VFLITDGGVEYPNETIEMIRKHCQSHTDTKVFTVGIGEEADQFFIDNAALAGKGNSVYVKQSNLDKLKTIVSHQLQEAVAPVMEDCTFSFG
jgi:hypothetical protein